MSAIEIIENLYRAFRNKDYDPFRALCSEDIEWIQNKGFPKSGPTRLNPSPSGTPVRRRSNSLKIR